MVTFNASPWKVEADGSLEFEVSLVHKVSSRTTRAIQRDPISKHKKLPLGWAGTCPFHVLGCQEVLPQPIS